MSKKAGKPLTGRKVLFIALAAFGLVIAANMALLFSSVGTFPGLVVANSYVASQGYDAERKAQIALGWKVAVHEADGRLAVEINDSAGAPVRGLEVRATVGRPSSDVDDVVLTLAPDASGYAVEMPHGPGLWRVEIEALGQAGAHLRAHTEILIRGA